MVFDGCALHGVCIDFKLPSPKDYPDLSAQRRSFALARKVRFKGVE